MRAGSINRRVQIDEPVTSQNETGEEETAFEEFATIWASIEPIRGREALLNGVNLAAMDTKIRLRWSPEIDAINTEWRIRYKATIYDILSLVHVRTGRREIELLCKSGSNDG